ncbi:MAG: type II toxin-antitoxin system VapC family toxin [Armatimonadota bacterium]|nr:type II toxin-antitoxin system VapC family toxin [Armatimonadota bacterium]
MEDPYREAGVVDTDILIDFARGVAQAGNFLQEQAHRGRILVSVVSAMELVAGCRDSMQLHAVQEFLANLHILPLTPVSSRRALSLMEQYFLSHGLLLADAMIAATAIEYSVPLYTKNVRHFYVIHDLVVIRPY